MIEYKRGENEYDESVSDESGGSEEHVDEREHGVSASGRSGVRQPVLRDGRQILARQTLA